jgi:hypothetical protein
MKLFIVCISFFLSELAFAKGCEIDHLACILSEKIPIMDLIDISIWIALGMSSFGFILFIGSSIYKSMQDEEKHRIKLEYYDNRLPDEIEDFKMEYPEEEFKEQPFDLHENK